jgi:BirA family transcriptional regulator, biotin operon repressor / biotin---[acetyl-CoA-carboxylase] ligase
MSTPREVWQLDTTAIGQKVLVYDRVESTNTLAAEFALGAKREQLAILAAEQTAGRGQHGRTWTAPPGRSVLLSLLLFPPQALRRAPVFTAWAAVSVCETIRHLTGVTATIKWPNDVLLRGKKVCGILIEQSRGTVVGIGLNVRQSAEDFLEAQLDATSLNQVAAESLSTEHVARTLLRVLDDQYALLLQGDLATLEEGWRSHLGLLGRQVVAECTSGVHRGKLRGLTFDLVELEQPGKPVFLVRPEQVQHLIPT